MVRAAVLPAVGAPLEITGIELPEPGPGQVRVRLAAAGVCHSDLSLSNGTMRVPVPAVLGHEGAGTVVSVGEGVGHVAPGDGVVLNWAPSCGNCHHCGIGEVWLCANALAGAANIHARTADGTELHPGLNVAAFAQETVVAANCVLPAPDGVPLTDAALLGCAVLTGYGAVHHSARVRAGESVVVFGIGGVGLAVLQSARIAGASRIIAVDVSPEKEELARKAGATDYVIASATTPREIRGLTGGQGADVAIECVGRAATIRTAWESTRRGRPHHGRRHRRQGPGGDLQRPGDLPLGPLPDRLRVREQRPGPRSAGAGRSHRGGPFRPLHDGHGADRPRRHPGRLRQHDRRQGRPGSGGVLTALQLRFVLTGRAGGVGARPARGRVRDTATPARQSSPPPMVRSAGTSSSSSQAISTTSAGTA